MLIEDFEHWKTKSNYRNDYDGMDSPDAPWPLGLGYRPRGWWKNYPIQDFNYKYNSWGFRGPEYEQYLGKQVNICLGDSFTVNIGGPIEHSWPTQLGKLLWDFPILNLGMDGAGNDAIRIVYDRACKLFDVQNAFVMHSYFHRRFEDNKFIHHRNCLTTDWQNTKHLIESMDGMDAFCGFIPDWCYSYEEMHVVDNSPHMAYPHNKEEWVNRDYHHMNKKLNKKVAEHYFNELSRTDAGRRR